MTSLADNMLMIRGIDVGIDSHSIGYKTHIVPVPGHSLIGCVGDKAKSPIPVAGRYGGGDMYTSKKGISYIEMRDEDPFSTALNPFLGGSSLSYLNNSTLEAAMDASLSLMSIQSGIRHKYLPSTFQDRLNAKRLMKRNLSNLSGAYTALKTKYDGLVARAFGDSSLRVNEIDNYLLSGDGSSYLFQTQAPVTGSFAGSDIRTLTNSSTYVPHMTESFAIAEYMITQGYSSAMNFTFCDFEKLFFQKMVYLPALNRAPGVDVTGRYAFDEHQGGGGAYLSLVIYARFYRAFSACLYELVSRLKSVPVANGLTLFDKTAITVTGDFGRAPSYEGNGSEHGPDGSNYSIISGMVPNLTIVGNIKTNGSLILGNCGTWGKAGAMVELGGRVAQMGNVSSTLSTMLEFDNPTPNDISLVYKSNGKVLPAVGRPKNVT
jgi:hypothetical protein